MINVAHVSIRMVEVECDLEFTTCRHTNKKETTEGTGL